jgi:hypothetical protein
MTMMHFWVSVIATSLIVIRAVPGVENPGLTGENPTGVERLRA